MHRPFWHWATVAGVSAAVFSAVFVGLTVFMVLGSDSMTAYQENPLAPIPPVTNIWIIETHPGQHVVPLVVAAGIACWLVVWALRVFLADWPPYNGSKRARPLIR